MYLYGFNRADKMFRIPVLKETPKGYKVKPTPLSSYRKFIRKQETRSLFEKPSLAKVYMREVLKARVCYAYVALQAAEKRLNKAKDEILGFDQRYNIELDATSDEASINMKDYRVHSIKKHIFVEELELATMGTA